MFPHGRCSVGTVELNTSFLFSTRYKYSCMAIKLWPIINYNQLRHSKLADNVLPYKLDDVFIFNGGEGFNFYPFAKIVGGN